MGEINKEIMMVELLITSAVRLRHELQSTDSTYERTRELRNRLAGAFDTWKKVVDERL